MGRNLYRTLAIIFAVVLLSVGMASSASPTYYGTLVGNAALTPSPAPTGYSGYGVIAQATAQPTMQPGNPYVGNYIMGDGIANGIWELCNNCSNSIGGYSLGHYHVFWATFPGDATAPADLAIGGCALCAGDASTTGQNNAIGVGALENKTTHAPITGSSNVAIGNISLGFLTSGSGNTAVGVGSGQCISTGSANIIIGDGLGLGSGCTADHNTLLGPEAGFEDSTSTGAVAIGWNAGENVTGGTSNIFMGFDAGQNAGSALTSAIFIGTSAGQASTASAGIGIGSNASQNLTGADSISIGNSAGKGASTSSDGGRTVAIGTSAGQNVTTGNHSVYIGFQSGLAVTAGNTNAYVGYQAGSGNTTGGGNTGLGSAACATVTTGTWNICIGNNATVPSATANGQMSIANAIFGFGNNLSGTGVSTGCIVFYATSCTAGTVASAVPLLSADLANSSTTQSYVAPVYTNAGAVVASTVHTVIGTCAFSSSVTCTPAGFSGAAVFASATSYSCSASGGAGTFAQTGALSVNSQSTTGIVITAATSNSQTVTYSCTGT